MLCSRDNAHGRAEPARNALASLTAIAMTTVLLHAQLASAMVTRGDDMLYQSKVEAAMKFYARALLLDPGSATAMDRYAFVAIMMQRRSLLLLAVRKLTAFLRGPRMSETLVLDRALCERALGQYAAAEQDFVTAGMLGRDARALVFAGYAALRLGSRERARLWWRLALEARRRYVPALRALAR
ncbi:MAG: hypothetical protein ACYDBM_07595 [Candidatus Tyrphobacter sp.]